MEPTIAGKWLELLKEIAPHVARVALLFNPATATYFDIYLKPFKAAALSFGVEAIAAPVHDSSDIDSHPCSTSARAEWRSYRSAGYLPARPS